MPAIPARRWRSRRSPTCSTREVLRHNPANPHWPNRDRFVLSAGHACVLQYSALHLSGYNLSLEELKRFRQWQSATPGHPEFRHTEGIEVTTGPLGQGFANGVGMALRRALPRRDVQSPAPRDRRPPRLRDLLGRRPDGGRLVRGRLARRARTRSASSSTSTTTTTSRSTARRRSRSPRIAPSGSRRSAGTSSTSPTPNDLGALRTAIAERAGRDDAAVADHRPLAHRLSARRTRSTRRSRTARRSARTRSRRRSRRSAGTPTSTSSSRTRSTRT